MNQLKLTFFDTISDFESNTVFQPHAMLMRSHTRRKLQSEQTFITPTSSKSCKPKSLSYSLSLFFSLSLSHTHTHSWTLICTLSYIVHTRSLILSLTHNLSYIFFLCRTHTPLTTHTHPHTHALPHTQSLTYTISPYLSL